jgi:hypothetical protein
LLIVVSTKEWSPLSIHWVKGLLPKPTVSVPTAWTFDHLFPIVLPFRYHHLYFSADRIQSKKQEIGNNLLAGTLGGFVGTSLNTPCESAQRILL